MTQDDLDKLTLEAKDIAIFHACPKISEGGYIQGDTPMRHLGGDDFAAWSPTRDLNDMHEAEAALSDEQFISYGQSMFAILGGYDAGVVGRIIHASAAHRADAFLLTIPNPMSTAPESGLVGQENNLALPQGGN